MMTKSNSSAKQTGSEKTGVAPSLCIKKLGIVSRDYNYQFNDGSRDFSSELTNILKYLDDKECDAVLFSLYSIVSPEPYNPSAHFQGLTNIKAVFLEEYIDEKPSKRTDKRFVIHHLTQQGWGEFDIKQKFGTITGMKKSKIETFVKNELPKRRIMGNSCVLLCGETNGVKYSPKDKEVKDTFDLRAAIPEGVNIVLNPIHDRMTRFEMKLKRQFLSQDKRWVVSVWNKGKINKNGVTRDGKLPAWTVYYNGEEVSISSINSPIKNIEIGIIDFENLPPMTEPR